MDHSIRSLSPHEAVDRAAEQTGEVLPSRRIDDVRPGGPLDWEVPSFDQEAADAQAALDSLRKYEINGEVCVRLNDAKALFQPNFLLAAASRRANQRAMDKAAVSALRSVVNQEGIGNGD